MARNIEPKCKQCRRVGEKLFLRGTRCTSPKCAMVRRAYPPGERGQERIGRLSEYGFQMKEKQKLKKMYGLFERQFRKCFETASRKRGVIGDNLLRILETRLDNVIYRLGFATSRSEARQMVSHGFIEVNSKKVDIPSFEVKKGDVIAFREGKQKKKNVEVVSKSLDKKSVPVWLDLNTEKAEGIVRDIPTREQIDTVADVKAVIELYSK